MALNGLIKIGISKQAACPKTGGVVASNGHEASENGARDIVVARSVVAWQSGDKEISRSAQVTSGAQSDPDWGCGHGRHWQSDDGC